MRSGVLDPRRWRRLKRPVPDFELTELSEAEAARVLARFGEDSQLATRTIDGLWSVVLAEEPGDVEARLGRARATALLGRPDEAEVELARIPADAREGRRYERVAAEIAISRARSASKEGREDAVLQELRSARGHYERALRDVPDDPETLFALGKTYLWDQAADPRQGIAYLERAEALSPLSPEIHLRLGRLRIRTRELDAARKHLEIAAWAGAPKTKERAEALLERLGDAGD